MKNRTITAISISLLLSISLLGCSNMFSSTKPLTEELPRNDISPIEIVSENDQTEALTQFSLTLFSSLNKEDNVLISPLSIITALSMTANGANHDTLLQMEEIFGADISALNEYLYAYTSNLANDAKYEVNLANSIWIKDSESLIISEIFLQKNVNYYDSQVFMKAFDSTLPTTVNSWVKGNTDGMIEEILDENVVPTASMYLINALSFDAEWENIYDESDIKTKEFTNYDGSMSETEMMYNNEYTYLSLENASGFQKYYADSTYSFVALLPDEGVDLYDFVASLDSETLLDAISNASNEKVYTSIPKFSVEYEERLKDVLISLGMEDAFDADLADFSYMTDVDSNSLYIEDVIHKTKIDVDEKGTKAGAVTVVSMTESASIDVPEVKEVYLDRPFFYMIVDETFHLPLFMGTYVAVSE